MFEHQYTNPAPYNGHRKIQFYIPKEQYTGLTAFTEIKCSSFVLHCTLRAGTLDLKQRPIDMAKKDVPKMEFDWTFSDIKESDPANVKCRPGPSYQEMSEYYMNK